MIIQDHMGYGIEGAARIFRAFMALRSGTAVGIIGFWPDRAFDSKFVAPEEERMVVEAFLASGSQVNAEMVNRLDDQGLSLVEVDVTTRDTVFSVYRRLMNAPAGPSASKTSLAYRRPRVRSGLIARALWR